MTLTVGRLSIPTGDAPRTWQPGDDGSLSLEFDIRATSLAETLAQRQLALGYGQALNLDEHAVPFLWDADTTVAGFLHVLDVKITSYPDSLTGNGYFSCVMNVVILTARQWVSRLDGGLRVNELDATNADMEPFACVPAASKQFAYPKYVQYLSQVVLAEDMTIAEWTRETASGDVICRNASAPIVHGATAGTFTFAGDMTPTHLDLSAHNIDVIFNVSGTSHTFHYDTDFASQRVFFNQLIADFLGVFTTVVYDPYELKLTAPTEGAGSYIHLTSPGTGNPMDIRGTSVDGDDTGDSTRQITSAQALWVLDAEDHYDGACSVEAGIDLASFEYVSGLQFPTGYVWRVGNDIVRAYPTVDGDLGVDFFISGDWQTNTWRIADTDSTFYTVTSDAPTVQANGPAEVRLVVGLQRADDSLNGDTIELRVRRGQRVVECRPSADVAMDWTVRCADTATGDDSTPGIIVADSAADGYKRILVSSLELTQSGSLIGAAPTNPQTSWVFGVGGCLTGDHETASAVWQQFMSGTGEAYELVNR